ncbi:Twinfilin-1 [Dimargaris verticillata]|uniref:Twinfilin-1 n=1 Tax=Dimargaris verticillata TaxID=2761393 RepID=A0A9W8E879_9FUNG|nr:Twinfilin-1 [Dimargaris verticillata]
MKLSAELQERLVSIRDKQESSTNVLKIIIEGGQFTLAASKEGPVSSGPRYNVLESLVDEAKPAYFLIQRDAGKWCFITWVPDGGKVSVRDRMLYASSQSALKFAVGFGCIADTVHLTSMDDICPRFRKGSANTPSTDRASPLSPRQAMSRHELDKLEALQMEDRARTERLARINSLSTFNDHGSTNKATPAAVSGGFHVVALPFTMAASNAVKSFLSGTPASPDNNDASSKGNILELKITADKSKVDLANTHRCDDIGAKFPVTTDEPRFYAIQFPDGPYAKETILVYLCPDQSPPKWRMVYSTAFASVVDEFGRLECTLDYKISLFSPTECTFGKLAEKIRSQSAQKLSRSRSLHDIINYHNNHSPAATDAAARVGRYTYKRNPNEAMASHPVYGLMATAFSERSLNGGSSGPSPGSPGSASTSSSLSGPKKKVVIPPPGAY